MRQVVVLRPEPGASATVKRARERGLDAAAAPLFEIEAVPWLAPDCVGFDALLITSANAVRCAGAQLEKFLSLPVYAVGEMTSKAALERGFAIALTGNRGVDQLIDCIPRNLRLLHLGGEDRRAPSERSGIVVIPVYRASEVEQPDLSLAKGAVILVHSPRAARRLADLVKDRGDSLIAAISPAAAEAAGAGWEAVEAAGEPSDDALLALAARLCNKPVPK